MSIKATVRYSRDRALHLDVSPKPELMKSTPVRLAAPRLGLQSVPSWCTTWLIADTLRRNLLYNPRKALLLEGAGTKSKIPGAHPKRVKHRVCNGARISK